MATKQKRIDVYIPEDEAAELAEVAEQEDRTVANVCRQAIRKFLRERREALAKSQ